MDPWSLAFGGTDDDEDGVGAVFDSMGNSYFIGHLQSDTDFGNGLWIHQGGADLFLVSFDPLGTLRWSRTMGNVNWERIWGLDVDTSDNIYVTGRFREALDFGAGPVSTTGSWNTYVAKYSNDGALVWFYECAMSGNDSARDLAIDASGNVLVTGFFSANMDCGGPAIPTVGGDDIYVLKLDTNGTPLWQWGGGSGADDTGISIAVDNTGNVYVTGFYAGSADFGGGALPVGGGEDIFALKLDADGNYLWSGGYGGSNTDFGRSIAVDSSGNFALTGYFLSDSIDFGDLTRNNANPGTEDGFVASFDTSNTLAWSTHFGTVDTDVGFDVAIDSNDRIHLCATYSGAVSFGGPVLPVYGAEDIAYAVYDSAGNYVDAVGVGSVLSDSCKAIAVDDFGNTLLTGGFSSSIDFGQGMLNSQGSSDVFFWRRDQL